MVVGRGKLDFSGVGVIPPYAPSQLKGETVKGKKILVVAGDRGGWNALASPLRRALDEGCEVRLFLVGTCAQQLAEGKLPLDQRMIVVTEKLPSVLRRYKFDLVILGASQSYDGAAAAAIVGDKCSAPRFAVQDLYGSSVPTFEQLLFVNRREKNFIYRVCVTDQFSREHFLRLVKFSQRDSVVVTGGPQFDKTLEVKQNWDERRKQLREELGIKKDAPVFLIAGQLNGTAEALALLTEAIIKCGLDTKAKIIVLPHPRSTYLDQQLLWYCESNLGLGAPIRLMIDKTSLAKLALRQMPSEDLLPAVDYVVSGYSTTNYYGILYGMPGVIYLGTPSFHWDLWQEKKLLRPPEVEAGAGWYVESFEDFVRVITAVQAGGASSEMQTLKQRQKAIAQHNDGHATDRVWMEMAKLLG